MRQADARAERQHDSRRHRQLVVVEALQIGLDEPDLRSDRARREIAGRNQLRAVRRIERFAGSRLSLKMVPENFDSRTCGNRRSISQASSSSVALMSKSLVRWNEYEPVTRVERRESACRACAWTTTTAEVEARSGSPAR